LVERQSPDDIPAAHLPDTAEGTIITALVPLLADSNAHVSESAANLRGLSIGTNPGASSNGKGYHRIRRMSSLLPGSAAIPDVRTE
jgi:hypothetical protein